MAENRLDKTISDVAYILDSLVVLRQIQSMGDCNVCKNKDCGYRPKPGQQARYNCPFYKAESEDKQMANVELVIKIPEGLKDEFERERWTALTCMEMKNALKNAVTLPKGHGDLIDRGKLKTHFVGTDLGTDLEVYLEPTVVNAPTIIEADEKGNMAKEVSDAKHDRLTAGTLGQTGWIPVTEKLPENGVEVLTCGGSGYIEIQSFEETHDCWENQNGDWCDIDYVVAWMPLPSSYRGL